MSKSPIERHQLQRKFTGIVMSAKAQKTLVVRVDRTLTHPLYGKQYIRSLRYKVHDEKGKYQEGDKVTFLECRPLSKEKRWRVLYA